MKTAKSMKRLLLVCGFALLGFLIYTTIFGRLSAFAPWVWGYEKLETRKAIIYSAELDQMRWYVLNLDWYIKQVEASHGLVAKEKIEFVFVKDDAELKRRTGTTARFVTMPVNGRVYISRKAQTKYHFEYENIPASKFDENEKKKHDLQTFLHHEISHSVMFKNLSLFNTFSYPTWFFEAIATLDSKMFGVDGYYTIDEVKDELKAGVYVSPADWGTVIRSKGPTVKNCPLIRKFRFIYAQYALILVELEEKYGREKLKQFIRKSLRSDDFDTLFAKEFNILPEQVLEKYRT